MTLYRKVFTKDRLPEKNGDNHTDYHTDIGSVSDCFINSGLCEWWLEEVEIIDDSEEHGISIGYNSHDRSIGVFTDGANYILNKLKG